MALHCIVRRFGPRRGVIGVALRIGTETDAASSIRKALTECSLPANL
jgi:hypothetical protein